MASPASMPPAARAARKPKTVAPETAAQRAAYLADCVDALTQQDSSGDPQEDFDLHSQTQWPGRVEFHHELVGLTAVNVARVPTTQRRCAFCGGESQSHLLNPFSMRGFAFVCSGCDAQLLALRSHLLERN